MRDWLFMPEFYTLLLISLHEMTTAVVSYLYVYSEYQSTACIVYMYCIVLYLCN